MVVVVVELLLVPHAILQLQVQVLADPAQLQQVGHLARQRHERTQLLFIQRPGNGVHHAQRSDGMAFVAEQRCAGVEAQPIHAGDHGVVAKALVQGGVGNMQNMLRVQDRMGAERTFTRGLACLQALARLEPLALGIDQRDRGHGHVTDGRSDGHHVVERGLGLGVEDPVTAQRRQAGFFVLRLVGLDQ